MSASCCFADGRNLTTIGSSERTIDITKETGVTVASELLLSGAGRANQRLGCFTNIINVGGSRGRSGRGSLHMHLLGSTSPLIVRPGIKPAVDNGKVA